MRQQNLRTTIDWSYRLLTPKEQALFAHLSVLVGAFTFEATEAVCAVTPLDLTEGMAALVDQSLLRQVGEDEQRFSMLETIREYAAERLQECGESEVVSRRHAEYYRSLVERHEEAPRGSAWWTRIDEDIDNVRQALAWCRDHEEIEIGLQLATGMFDVWRRRGAGGEGRRWLQDLLVLEAGAATPAPGFLRADALMCVGWLASQQGDLRGTSEAFDEARALVERSDDPVRRAWIESARGRLALAQGDRERAITRLDSSLTVGREQQQQTLIIESLIGLAMASGVMNDLERSESLYQEALVLARQEGDRAQVAQTLGQLASVVRRQGEHARADAYSAESAQLGEEGGDLRLVASRLLEQGAMARGRGDLRQAKALYEQSLALHQSMGDEGDIAQVLRNLGQLAQDEGDLDRADALLLECLALSRESGSNWGMISALSGLAFGAWFRGDYLRAKALMEECISLCREADDHRQTAGQLSYLALLARERGDYPRARALLEEALTLSRELNLGVQSGYALLGLGDVARDQVDHEAVERLCEESLTMFRTVNERPGMAWSLHNLGLAALMRGDLRRARALCEESLSIMRDAFPDEFPTSEVLLGLGMIALGERNLDRARALLTNALGHARQHGPKWMVAAGLEGLAQVAAAEQQYDRAARFFGAADALRTRIGVPIRPFLVPRHERVLAEVYRALGQQAHARAWEAGRDVPLGEAVADALDESEDVQWRHAHDT